MANEQLKRALKERKKEKKRIGRIPIPLAPRRLERDYYRELQPMINRMWNAIQTYLIPRVTALADKRNERRADAEGDEVRAAMDIVFTQGYSEEEIARIARKKGIEVSEYNREVMERGLKRVAGVDIFVLDPFLSQELEIFAVNNVSLIKNMTNDMRRKIENRVFTGFREGLRAEELAKQISATMNPKDGEITSRAKFIARDQVAKLNGDLNQLRQTELGLKSYIWRTSLDERVRDSHAAKEGEQFNWNNPPSDTGHPGQDFNCRCVAEPVLDSVLDL